MHEVLYYQTFLKYTNEALLKNIFIKYLNNCSVNQCYFYIIHLEINIYQLCIEKSSCLSLLCKKGNIFFNKVRMFLVKSGIFL